MIRMQYHFVNFGSKTLSADQARYLLEDKFDLESFEGSKLCSNFSNQQVHFFHVTKVAAFRELRQIFFDSEAMMEDHLYSSSLIENTEGSFLPHHLPFLFVLVDSTVMQERALETFYEPELTKFCGKDLLYRLS